MAELDPAVTRILTQIKPGQDERLSRNTRFDRAYDTYRATQPRTYATENWQSKLRVPYARQVIDTGMVNIVSGAPKIKVSARHPDGEMRAKAMQCLLDYYVGEDHLVEKQPVFAQQGLVYGITVAKNHWLYQKAKRPGRDVGPDGLVGRDPKLMDVTVRDGPTFEPWDVYRAYWTPGARSADDAEYVALETYLSKDQLLSNACTIGPLGHEGACDGLYHNVQALLSSGGAPQPSQTAQARANRLAANDFTRYRDKFLITEIWRDSTLQVLGNEQIILRAQTNPYWHGRKPVVIAQTMPDLFEMLGIPETEAVDHLQQAQWTLQNMVIDNLHLTVMRGITYREGGVTDPNELQLRPRFKWPVSDHDDVRPFEIAPIGSDVYNERQRLLADMQLVTGINPYVSGSDLHTVDQNTATGVTALQEVASRLLRFKAAQIHYKGYQRSFEMWGDMAQQFLSDEGTWVKIVGQGNQEAWAQVTPGDVAGHFHYLLEGSEESLSRQQERGEAVALLNAFAPLAQLGIINFKPVLEKVATAYDFPNPEMLFNAPPPPASPAAPNGGGQMPGAGQDFFNVRSPQIGQVPQHPGVQQQGGLQMDPRLQSALALLPQR